MIEPHGPPCRLHNVLQLTRKSLSEKFRPRVRISMLSTSHAEVSIEPPRIIAGSDLIKKRYSSFIATKLVEADKQKRTSYLNMFHNWSVDVVIDSARPEDLLCIDIRIENLTREFFEQSSSMSEMRDVLKLSARDLEFALSHKHLPYPLSLERLLELRDNQLTRLQQVVKDGLRNKRLEAKKEEREALAAQKWHVENEIRRVAVGAGDIKARTGLELALCCSLLGHSLLQAKTKRHLNAARIVETGIRSLETMGYAYSTRTAAFITVAGYESVFVPRRISRETTLTVCKLRRHQIGSALLYACRLETKKLFPESYLMSRIEEIAKLVLSSEGNAFAAAA